ncbi:excinuclease ABC subunit UvrA, partial [Myxococcota bacterium]|nr:excinuclease ABC subunit UvrA [Myxococcota bacterium]
CYGLGVVSFYDPGLFAPDHSLSLDKGALLPLEGTLMRAFHGAILALGRKWGFSFTTKLVDYPVGAVDALFHGDETINWPGMVRILERGEKLGQQFYEKLGLFRQSAACPSCSGTRLRPEVLAIRVDGINIHQFTSMSIEEALEWAASRSFGGADAQIADPLLKELVHRLKFLHRVGLDYLSLSREMSTVSGGEAQRIRLASQLGTGLVGVTYVLDEPTIGLHQKDNLRLLDTLRELQTRGNTVLVVEHDEQTILTADHIIELGPGSGRLGGEIVFQGSVARLMRSAESLTAQYLRRERSAPRPALRRRGNQFLIIRGATAHNLKNLSVQIPLEALSCVTGVSGSGKSTLVMDTLYKNLARKKGIKAGTPGPIKEISGTRTIEKIIVIDQSPIGRTPRSNPATYTKIFDDIRAIFASLPESKVRGYDKGRFSFNVKGGRCEACSGDGEIKVEMHFLPDVYVTCDVCRGKRYNHETLEIAYRDRSISDILNMTVLEAFEFFTNYPSLKRRLEVLMQVGLDYIQLGQPATTLSGGEAQRIKISRELGKRSLPGTIYILDEPTTGLHMHEVGKLIEVLHSLVDKRATVVLIEHNLDVIAAADHVIDLGPGGGHNGGQILAQGTPEEVAANENSVTGLFLRQAVDILLP